MADSGSQGELEAQLASLPHPVRLVFFTQTFGCDTCLSARQVVDRLATLSDQITVDEYNLLLDKEPVAEYDVDRAPAIAVVGGTDLGIRYYGVPAGYEVASLVDAVLLVGRRDPPLSDRSLAAIATLDRPVDIKVFVTPT